MAQQPDVEIELQPFNSQVGDDEDCDKSELKDEKKKKRINFSSEVQVSERKAGKTVQFSKPQVSFDDHSSVGGTGYEIKAHLIPNKKREEEEVMENLRKKVGEFGLDKNWKQKDENADDGRTFDHDDCETNPLLKAKSEQQTTDDEFIIDCLCWHNEYRARHNVSAMNLSKKLCVSAQEWANHIASRDELYYCPPSQFNFGQSIFCCAETALLISISGQEVATYWYSSIKRYDWTKPWTLLHTNVNSGHFSQLVWKKSKFLGVGKSMGKSGKIYVVAFYFPPGNLPYEFHKNVFPPLEVKQETTRPSSSASSYNK